MRAASRTFSAFGNVSTPPKAQVESEIERLARLRFVAGEAVHDAAAVPVARSIDSVSSQASRVWMTMGLPPLRASASCAIEDRRAARRAARNRNGNRGRFRRSRHLGMRRQLAQRVEGFGRGFGGVVRMHADGGVDKGIAVGQAHGRLRDRADRCRCRWPACIPRRRRGRARWTASRSASNLLVVQVEWVENRSASLQARSDRDVFVEAGQHRLAAFTDAATIMPFDSMPRSLRGCRLATITTLRPIRSAGRRLRRCRPRWCAAAGFADIDLHVHQLVGALHGLGGEHQADAQVDLQRNRRWRFWRGPSGTGSGFLPIITAARR
jgi:hypothetical protein